MRARMGLERAGQRMNDQVQVLQRNGSEEDLIAKDEGADEAGSLLASDLDGAHIGNLDHGAISKPDLSGSVGLEGEPVGDGLRDAKVVGARIDQRGNFQRPHGRGSRVAQSESSVDSSHGCSLNAQ
jgi:hypothetical protein